MLYLENVRNAAATEKKRAAPLFRSAAKIADTYLYPPSMIERFHGEQYLLAVWLLGGAQGNRIIMHVAAHAGRNPDILKPLRVCP
jgi:hypothetical protein